MMARWVSSGRSPPKFCQRPSDMAGSIRPLRPVRRNGIRAYRGPSCIMSIALVMVVVCGEALIDRIHLHPASQRVGLGDADSPGGGPFNTARALARLNIPTQFLGRLSTDAFGQQLRDLLEADGADLSLTSFGPEPTSLAIADVDRDGHAAYRFVMDGASAPNLTQAMLPASFAAG